MKKITLSVALLAAVLTAKSQDTVCTYFTGDRVFEFDFKTSEPIHENLHETKYYTVEVGYRQVLCLDLSDQKKGARKVVTTYPDGTKFVAVLNSKDKVYYTGFGPLKVKVSKQKLFFPLITAND